MKCLANLYITFLSTEGFNSINGNAIDIFFRENFQCLCNVIDELTFNEDKTLKPGLRQNFFYLIKKAAKIIFGFQNMKGNENLPEEIKRFVICFDSNEDSLVSHA